MVVLDFGGVKEEVVTRDEFPLSKAVEVLKNEVLAVIGYGIQAPAQALNLRNRGLNVIIGQRKGRSYENIKQNLKVSSATVASIQSMLDKKGIKLALKKIEAEEWANLWSERIKKFVGK